MLELKLNHATVKQAETISPFERSHGPLKYLKIYENELKHDLHKHFDLAVFQQNTSYHTVLGCSPTLVFEFRISLNSIILRFNNRTLPKYSIKFDYVIDLQTKLNNIFATTKNNLATKHRLCPITHTST